MIFGSIQFASVILLIMIATTKDQNSNHGSNDAGEVKTQEKHQELATSFINFLDEYKQIVESEKTAVVSPVHVDELASKIATIYEKIRRIIDWKEEHLIRRLAIERVLKRMMISQISAVSLITDLHAEGMAEPLVVELVRNGYFPNDKISRNRIPYVKKALGKYIYILKNSAATKSALSLNIKGKVNFYSWILSIAACEIEEILDPPFAENALINYMTYRIYERCKVFPQEAMTDSERFYQCYIAVHRSLFNLDEPIITYHLIRSRYPEWTNNVERILPQFTADLMNTWKSLTKELSHTNSGRFYKICEQYDTVYLAIGDLLEESRDDIDSLKARITQNSNLENLVRNVYDKRLSTLKSRLSRSAIYSTLSILLGGALSLFIIEVPIAKLVYGKFSLLAIIVDLLLPTIFMFFLVAIIRLPSKKNFSRVMHEIEKVIYDSRELDVYEIDLKRGKGLISNIVFGLLFSALAMGTLALMFWVFRLAGIPWTSIYIDTLNIAVIIFAAYVIRQRAREMTVEESSNIFEFFLDMISIPIAKIGQWLSRKWQEYNIVSVFFSAVVDLPVSSLIQIFEAWRAYLKDKRSGIH